MEDRTHKTASAGTSEGQPGAVGMGTTTSSACSPSVMLLFRRLEPLPMFPGDLELDALFEDHGVSWLVTEDMVALEWVTYRRCFPAQIPLQPGRGSTGKNALTSNKILLPLPFSRPAVHTFLFSSWTLLTDGLKVVRDDDVVLWTRH